MPIVEIAEPDNEADYFAMCIVKCLFHKSMQCKHMYCLLALAGIEVVGGSLGGCQIIQTGASVFRIPLRLCLFCK